MRNEYRRSPELKSSLKETVDTKRLHDSYAETLGFAKDVKEPYAKTKAELKESWEKAQKRIEILEQEIVQLRTDFPDITDEECNRRLFEIEGEIDEILRETIGFRIAVIGYLAMLIK